jgi:UDP:flavonoid glycosyltransferase YjiC (YdhE family)
MAHFLFLTWPGSGNQPPAIGTAQELQARGHVTTFAGYASQRDRFVQLGFEFHVLQEAETLVPESTPEDLMALLVGAVWACPAHLRDLPAILSREHYDVVVVDCLMFGALAAAEVAGLPTAVLVHSAPGLLMEPGGPLEQMIMEPVNAVRHAAGLNTVSNLWQAWERFPTLCTTIPELDPLASQTPATFRFVGPVVDRVPHSGWQAPWPEHDPRPLVVVSFNAGGGWDQRSRIERTLEALGSGTYRVLVTSGMTNVDGLPVPPNAVVVPFVPHSEIMGQAAITITHAGHGTVAAALAHGVPLVCLPNLAADQPGLAAQVAQLGAGIALAGDTASPGEIARAVAEINANPSYAARARQLAEAIAGAGGAAGAATVLEQSVGVSPR